MQMNMYKKIIMIIQITMLLGTIVYSQNVSKTGTTAANVLEIGVGANSISMGESFVSIANDASALYWNAAGIADLNGYQAIISHTDWIAETDFDFAGLTIPLGDFGTIGFSFTSLSMDDMKVRTVEQPDGTGEYFSSNDLVIGLAYARKLTERFSIGFNVKYIEQNIWHMKASAFAIDAGTKFRTDLFGGMVIGASMSNFGTPMKLDGRDTRYFIRIDETKEGSNESIPTNIELDEWDLPLIFRIGVSTNIINQENYKLLVAADAIVPNNDYQSMNIGAELNILNYLNIRGGFNSLFLEDSEGGLTLGIGLNSQLLLSVTTINFDYAYRDFGRLNDIHTFSLSLMF